MIISGAGMGATTLLFSATFSAALQPGHPFLGSFVLKTILTNDVFILVVLGFYFVFFNAGFAPIKYTLRSELLMPKEQVRFI